MRQLNYDVKVIEKIFTEEIIIFILFYFQIYFKSEDDKPLAILQLKVEPQPHVIDQTFRFHCPEQTFLKKSIRLPPLQSLPGESLPLINDLFHVIDSTSCHRPNIPLPLSSRNLLYYLPCRAYQVSYFPW